LPALHRCAVLLGIVAATTAIVPDLPWPAAATGRLDDGLARARRDHLPGQDEDERRRVIPPNTATSIHVLTRLPVRLTHRRTAQRRTQPAADRCCSQPADRS